MKRLISTLVLVPALVVLAACGDDGAGLDDERTGSFTVTISGDVSQSFTGEAVFGEASDPSTGEAAWVVTMGTDDSETDFKVFSILLLDPRPGTGTYTFDDISSSAQTDGQLGAVYSGGNSTDVVIVVSTGGTLTITESAADFVSGSFSVQAEGTAIVGGAASDITVTITGEFDAVGGVVSYPTG